MPQQQRTDTHEFNFVAPQANQDFYKPYLQDYADEKKNFYPHEYKQFGQYAWIEISDYWQTRIKDALINIQSMCLPTFSRLYNDRNIAQIQQRIYLKLKRYEDEFNNCHYQARNPEDASYCAEILEKRLKIDGVRYTKEILEEY